MNLSTSFVLLLNDALFSNSTLDKGYEALPDHHIENGKETESEPDIDEHNKAKYK